MSLRQLLRFTIVVDTIDIRYSTIFRAESYQQQQGFADWLLHSRRDETACFADWLLQPIREGQTTVRCFADWLLHSWRDEVYTKQQAIINQFDKHSTDLSFNGIENNLNFKGHLERNDPHLSRMLAFFCWKRNLAFLIHQSVSPKIRAQIEKSKE